MHHKNIISSNLGGSKIWPRSYSNQALLFSFILVGFISIIFNDYMMKPLVLGLGLSIIIFFFLGIHYYFSVWEKIDFQKFYNKLFWHSFFYRLIFIGILYLLTYVLDPQNFPFEIGAADSSIYHNAGIQVAEEIQSGNVFNFLENNIRSFSDYGFPLYNGIIYYIFGASTLVIRLFNALLGSLTVVYISKISRHIFGDMSGRVAGIITMMMPALLWYTGMHLKETLMIFIITTVFYKTTQIVHEGKIKVASFLILILFTLSLFYFRLFLAVFIIICISFYFLFMFSKRRINRGIIIVSLMIFILTMVTLIGRLGFEDDVFYILDESRDRFFYELTYAAKDRGISYERGLVSPFILAGSLVTPFPSLLDFEERQLGIYSKFQNELIRNIMYFFAFMGILYAVRKLLRQSSLILLFTLGYIFILTVSAVSFQDRYQLPTLPFMIIFMSAGINFAKKPLKKKWFLYLIFILIAIFVWNYFKMSIRGLA